MSKSTFKNRGFVWFSDAKLRHKKAGRKQNPVGVKFLRVSCREVAFCESFWGKMAKFLRVFESFVRVFGGGGDFPLPSQFLCRKVGNAQIIVKTLARDGRVAAFP